MLNKFVGLIILDGFGIREEQSGNAISLANPKNFYNYYNNCPSTLLDASGEAVGLPDGVMGNSETGHLNIGAGRLVQQKLQKINSSIKNASFLKNETILESFNHTKNNNSNLHIMGLLSDGGVHSHINHLFSLIDMANDNDVKNIYIHCFLDGRDTYQDSGIKYLQQLQDKISSMNNVKIASIMGRFYAMDREKNWERTELAYNTLVLSKGEEFSNNPVAAVQNSYNNGVMDEFVKPVVITDNGEMYSIKDNDSVIFFNFRDDRARQITASFVEDDFDKFNRHALNNVYFCGFSEYDTFKNLHPAYREDNLAVNLSQIVSTNGLKQFKIAETTKYAHVTFYLNGGIETPYEGESRFLIETIKGKAFDETPQMRTVEITEKAIEEIKSEKYSFMALNYSNCDMLGHTGNLESTIKSVQIMDEQLKLLVDAIISIGGVAVITADHGNAEKMFDEEGRVLTEHTTSKVPFVVVNAGDINLKEGKLGNIAPTILQLLGVNKPDELEESLII